MMVFAKMFGTVQKSFDSFPRPIRPIRYAPKAPIKVAIGPTRISKAAHPVRMFASKQPTYNPGIAAGVR